MVAEVSFWHVQVFQNVRMQNPLLYWILIRKFQGFRVLYTEGDDEGTFADKETIATGL